MMSLENRRKLKKIYQEEYTKALKDAKTQHFNNEIERIKSKAKADVKRKFQSKKKRVQNVVNKSKKKTGKARKTVKKIHKHATVMQRFIEMNPPI